MNMDLALLLSLRHGLDALRMILRLTLLKQRQFISLLKHRARLLQYTLYGSLVTYIVLGSRTAFQYTTGFQHRLI
jgi:hypothetical protein